MTPKKKILSVLGIAAIPHIPGLWLVRIGWERGGTFPYERYLEALAPLILGLLICGATWVIASTVIDRIRREASPYHIH